MFNQPEMEESDPSYSDDLGPDETPTAGKMIESYDKHELLIAHHHTDLVPYQGMEFDSEDSARAFYYAYAARAGFRVRVSRCQRSMRDGSITCRRFVCSREGFCNHNKNPGAVKRQRATARVGCMAMLLVKKQPPGPGNKWVVSKFVEEHNHEQPEAAAVAGLRRMDLKPCTVVKARKLEEDHIESPVEEERSVAAALPRGNPDLEPYAGMQFQSEEAARTFYYAYANDVGFTVRISKCRRARDGSIICRRFVCSKEGYYVRKYGRTKRSRALTRVGCLARLVVKRLDSGTWVIANFEKEHNHPPFVASQELRYQPPEPTRQSNHCAGMPLPASSGSLVNWTDTESQNGEISMACRFNKLHQQGIRFAEEGATSVEIFNVAMLALREATQKVVAAKRNAGMTPLLDSLVNSSGNQATLTNQEPSIDETQSASSNRVMLIQQPMNLVLFASGLPNDAGQVPSAIRLPNDQAVHDLGNQQINISVPVAVQEDLSPAENSLDESESVSSGMSEGRKHEYKVAVDDMGSFISVQDYTEGDSKQDGVKTQTQGWNIIGMGQPGPNTGSGGNSTNVALSEVQVAVEARKTPSVGPNPLVHAAAIAAGARIASPAVAASLMKAVQSRNVVRIRSGGGGSSAPPRVPVVVRSGGGDSLPTLVGAQQNSNNFHYYFPTEEPPHSPSLSPSPSPSMPPLVSTGGMQSSLALMEVRTDVSHAGLEEDHTVRMYHCVDLAEQQDT